MLELQFLSQENQKRELELEQKYQNSQLNFKSNMIDCKKLLENIDHELEKTGTNVKNLQKELHNNEKILSFLIENEKKRTLTRIANQFEKVLEMRIYGKKIETQHLVDNKLRKFIIKSCKSGYDNLFDVNYDEAKYLKEQIENDIFHFSKNKKKYVISMLDIILEHHERKKSNDKSDNQDSESDEDFDSDSDFDENDNQDEDDEK